MSKQQPNSHQTFFAALMAIGELFALIFGGMAMLFLHVIYGIRDVFNTPQRDFKLTVSATRIDDPTELRKILSERATVAGFPSKEDFVGPFYDRFLDAFQRAHIPVPNYDIRNKMVRLAQALYDIEEFPNLAATPSLSQVISGEIEQAKFADRLLLYMKKVENPARSVDCFSEAMVKCFVAFATHLPQSAFSEDEGVKPLAYVPVIDAITNIGQTVYDIMLPFYSASAVELNIFDDLRRDLYEKQLAATPDSSPKLIEPYNFKGTPQHIVDTFLNENPLSLLFQLLVPFSIKPETRLEHWHMLAPTGWGKTQTLQHIIYHDLTGPEPPALVIVEPKGDMAGIIQKLKLFADKPERIAIIDPAFNPALNMFALHAERLDKYDQTVREEIEGKVIRQYGYIFSALDADISRTQSTALAYVVKLVLSLRGNMQTFLDVLNDPAKKFEESEFRGAMLKLDKFAIAFFKNLFFVGTFPITRRALASKILGLPSISPSFGRMFTADDNRLDMFERIQTPGSVTIVNTRQTSPKDEASIVFGRYMIAQTMAAAFERAAIPESKRKPAYLIIDEAGSYFDESIEDILVQARSMGLGILFAHQFLGQLKSASLKSSVLGMPAIKFAAPIEEDLSTMASNMRTTSDFLRSMKHARRTGTQYGVYIRGEQTPSAVRLYIPFGTMEKAPQMTEEQHKALLTSNRKRYGIPDVNTTAEAEMNTEARQIPEGQEY